MFATISGVCVVCVCLACYFSPQKCSYLFFVHIEFWYHRICVACEWICERESVWQISNYYFVAICFSNNNIYLTQLFTRLSQLIHTSLALLNERTCSNAYSFSHFWWLLQSSTLQRINAAHSDSLSFHHWMKIMQREIVDD